MPSKNYGKIASFPGSPRKKGGEPGNEATPSLPHFSYYMYKQQNLPGNEANDGKECTCCPNSEYSRSLHVIKLHVQY